MQCTYFLLHFYPAAHVHYGRGRYSWKESAVHNYTNIGWIEKKQQKSTKDKKTLLMETISNQVASMDCGFNTVPLNQIEIFSKIHRTSNFYSLGMRGGFS